MKRKNLNIQRRQFLKGIGGYSLGLPFLPSLVPGTAFGQDPVFETQKRFIAMTTNHGGIFESAMYPDEQLLTESSALYPGHTVSRGDLQTSIAGADRVLSDVLRAPSSEFSAEIVQKMNVLRGLDIPFYIAHHTGGHLGNYARNDGNGEDGREIHDTYMPTIDQLMAWSPNFYQDLNKVALRSVTIGTTRRLSWNWSNPSMRSGSIEEVTLREDYQTMFDDLFRPSDSTTEQTNPNAFIVDRVLENYQSLRQSNRRMSAEDAQRLDDHMDRIFELQRRINASAASNAALCRDLTVDANPGWGDYERNIGTYIDIAEAALLCGTCSVVVLGLGESYLAEDDSDWHHAVAHQWNLEGPQIQLQDVNRQIFRHAFLDLANKLNVEEAPGVTVLDNSLIQWTQESGEATHDSRSAPVITCGGAAGFLSTGNYCDYRNKTEAARVGNDYDINGYSGLLHNQWLATALQAMGLPPSEWQDIPNNAPYGYGVEHRSNDYTNAQVTGVWENASQILPFLGT